MFADWATSFWASAVLTAKVTITVAGGGASGAAPAPVGGADGARAPWTLLISTSRRASLACAPLTNRTPTWAPAEMLPPSTFSPLSAIETCCMPGGILTVPGFSSVAGSTKRLARSCSPGMRSAVATLPVSCLRSVTRPGTAARAGSFLVATLAATDSAVAPMATGAVTTSTLTSRMPAMARWSAAET